MSLFTAEEEKEEGGYSEEETVERVVPTYIAPDFKPDPQFLR